MEQAGRRHAARSKEEHPMANRLQFEQSPYLLQHRETLWTGAPGGARPFRPRGRRTNRCSSASATPPATGAMSWPRSPLKMSGWRSWSTIISSHQSGPGGAPGCGRSLHGRLHRHDGLRRLAAHRAAHAGTKALLGGDISPPGRRCCLCCTRRRCCGGRTGTACLPLERR